MRWSRLLPLLAAAIVCCCAAASANAAAAFSFHNPMRNGLTGKPLSCPDPSVIGADRGKWRYFLVCTSDNARNAFPIWMSEDLVHWYPNGYVFPYHHQPWWSVRATGRGRSGLYWAPSIYRIQNRWVVYFAAQYNNQSKALGSARLAPGTMVIGVATATSLKGPWHTRVLHYPGQDNAVNGPRAQEVFGGDIDPGVVRDERTGRLYLFWAQQKQWIWEGALSPDGLSLNPHIAAAFGVSEPWECDAGGKKECVIEGPEPFYHDGRIYVMYSAASTWNASYSVGVASAVDALDPTQPFVKYPKPILTTGNGFYGPGRTSHPVVGPRGQSLILYHALLGRITQHINSARTLMIGDLNWNGDWPVVNDGKAH